MKKIYLITAILLVCASAWCLRTFFAPRGRFVEIIRDGRVIERIDLAAEKDSRTITLTSPDGGVNVLLIENGRVRVLSANCRGQDCVKMGWLRSASLPLVCLPHHLTVRFASGAGGALDSVSQ